MPEKALSPMKGEREGQVDEGRKKSEGIMAVAT